MPQKPTLRAIFQRFIGRIHSVEKKTTELAEQLEEERREKNLKQIRQSIQNNKTTL